jgi:hypothetical protein
MVFTRSVVEGHWFGLGSRVAAGTYFTTPAPTLRTLNPKNGKAMEGKNRFHRFANYMTVTL